jgi:hypothetical protein
MCWLSCKHYYHFKCLEKWLSKSSTCPTCRMQATHFNVDMIRGNYIEICSNNGGEYSSEDESSEDSEEHVNNTSIYNENTDTELNDISSDESTLSNTFEDYLQELD